MLKRLLDEQPGLATMRIRDNAGCERSLLLIATDWPGHYPNCTGTIATLVAAGADATAASTRRRSTCSIVAPS